jgi:hypothetical protein
MICDLHVSRDGQLVECQSALGLHGPEGANALKDKRVWDGRILEALCSAPFSNEEEKGNTSKHIIGSGLDTTTRTSHAVAQIVPVKARMQGMKRIKYDTTLTFEPQFARCRVRRTDGRTA